MHWVAEHTSAESGETGWAPTLVDDGCMFGLPILFSTEEECRAYIATIPAGAHSDGSECAP